MASLEDQNTLEASSSVKTGSMGGDAAEPSSSGRDDQPPTVMLVIGRFSAQNTMFYLYRSINHQRRRHLHVKVAELKSSIFNEVGIQGLTSRRRV